MTSHPRILVFIPAFRCAPQIVRVLEQFREPSVHHWFSEILVIDNVSPDDTADVAVARARDLGLGKVTVARNRENYGLGGSHKAAFTYAMEGGFSHVVTLHGDDQGEIRDLLPTLEAGDHERFDCCLGARFHAKSRISGYSPIRIAGNRVFNGLFSLVAGRRLHDLGSGLNLYRTSSLATRYWLKFHDNLMFNYCMILAHVQRKDTVTFFPISWREDDQVSNVRLASQARRTLLLLAHFAKDRTGFMSHEHRSHLPPEYRFDVLAREL